MTGSPVGAGFGVAVKEAVGAPVLDDQVGAVVAVAPRLSVTRRPIVRSPALA